MPSTILHASRHFTPNTIDAIHDAPPPRPRRRPRRRRLTNASRRASPRRRRHHQSSRAGTSFCMEQNARIHTPYCISIKPYLNTHTHVYISVDRTRGSMDDDPRRVALHTSLNDRLYACSTISIRVIHAYRTHERPNHAHTRGESTRRPVTLARRRLGTTTRATTMGDDGDDDDAPTTWWGRLMPTSEDAVKARHVDRAVACATTTATTRGGGLMLRMRSSVVGRIVMNKDGTARAKTQPADVALDVASGACARERRVEETWRRRDRMWFFLNTPNERERRLIDRSSGL